MKKLLFIMPLVALLFAFVACENENYDSYPPTWKGFILSPTANNIYAGDSLKVTACQDMKGHLINATTYSWSLRCQVLVGDNNWVDSICTLSTHTNYDGTSNADPTITFLVPKGAAGRATVSFQAIYGYSGSGIQVSGGGTYNDQYSGAIHSESGALSGKASGTVSFNVKTR